MKRAVVLRGVAAREFEDAVAWCEADREGLGGEFRAIIKQHFQRIAANPELFRKVRGEVRRAVVLRRFHYVIHFIIEPERIVILSVFHCSRNPEQVKYRR
jgi:plasmid stabilization system protein ParE